MLQDTVTCWHLSLDTYMHGIGPVRRSRHKVHQITSRVYWHLIDIIINNNNNNIHLVFFFVTFSCFFLVVHTRFCPVFTCPHSFLNCSTLFFPLVPRVSWLRARGYLPSASDWLRGTRDPYYRNLYNNNNDFGHTANSRCTLRKIYLNPIPFPTIVMMIIETSIKHIWW